jgi:hypothetical protein
LGRQGKLRATDPNCFYDFFLLPWHLFCATKCDGMGFVEENATRCDGLADYSTALKMNRLMLRVAFARAKRSPFF